MINELLKFLQRVQTTKQIVAERVPIDVKTPPVGKAEQPRRSDRKYRPWWYEFHGARYWPWLNIERYVDEELRHRCHPEMANNGPLWPPEEEHVCGGAGTPSVFALDPPYRATGVVKIHEKCCTNRRSDVPVAASCPEHRSPRTYTNFANLQFLPP